MGKLRKIVGVSLAVAVVAAIAVYVLMPRPALQNTTVSVPPPNTPTNGGSGGTTGGTPSPDVRPPKLHGQNSNGPKHAVCLPVNEHVQGIAQYQGANWYRGTCGQSPGANSQGHAYAWGQAHAGGQDIARFVTGRGH